MKKFLLRSFLLIHLSFNKCIFPLPIDDDGNFDTLTNENNTGSAFVPQFMLDLYNVVADEYGITREGAPYLGKTINCIYAQGNVFGVQGEICPL